MKLAPVMLIILLQLLAPVTLAQDDDAPPISPDLMAVLNELDAITTDIRGLPLLEPVVRRFPTRPEVFSFIEEQLDAELTDEAIFNDTQFYRAFDFVGPDFDLEATFVALLGEQVAGYYDPEAKEMNVVAISGEPLEDTLPGFEQVTYVHEMVHVLQDQHFDLIASREQVDINEPDQLLAVTALIEGDATLVMQEFVFVLVQREPEILQQIMELNAAGVGEIPEGTPAILEAELMMPYLAGMNLAMQIRANGGWEAVDAAFANPPISTEQVLHPDKYISGEMPLDVTVESVEDVLGEGWQFVQRRTLGEFYLASYIETMLGQDLAQDAAAGWGGDQYELHYNTNTDQHAWVLRLAWDSPDDQQEFISIYGEFAAARFGDAESDCWRGEADVVCLIERADDVILAYAPDADIAHAMIDAQ